MTKYRRVKILQTDVTVRLYLAHWNLSRLTVCPDWHFYLLTSCLVCKRPVSLKIERPTWCHLVFHFTSYVSNMFRKLIYPSSGACDYSVELPYWSYCSWFDVCWGFGVVGLEWYPCCRLKHTFACVYRFHVHKNSSFILWYFSIFVTRTIGYLN